MEHKIIHEVNINLLGLDKLISLLFDNNSKLANIMATQKEDAAALAAISAQLAKANAEIQKKIQDLIDAAANVPVSDELQAAIDALVPAAQALDDIVLDA